MKRYALFISMILIVVAGHPTEIFSQEQKSDPTPPQIEEKGKAADVSVKAYYFHGTRRCKTCLTIESNAKKTLDTAFSAEMTQGVVTWQAIDIDLQENKHYEKEFDLMFSSVILVKFKNGRQVEWKNLQKVWELVGDVSAFESYIKNEMNAYLDS